MVWPPFTLNDVVQVATPPTVGDVPRKFAPSVNVTSEPSGTGGADVSVALKVTDCPSIAGFNDDVSCSVTAATKLFVNTPRTPFAQLVALMQAFEATRSILPSWSISAATTDVAIVPPALKTTA